MGRPQPRPRRLPHARLRRRRRERLSAARPPGGPRLHGADHGGPGHLAGRHRGRHAHAGDRQAREEARGDPEPRLHQELHQARPGDDLRLPQGIDAQARPRDIWYQVRKKVSDIKATLPQGVVGPFFNDEFGDVFGIIYGITYDGFTPREARDFAETARAEFLRAPDVGKVDIFGDQDEKVYLTSRRRSSPTSSSASTTCSRRSPGRMPSCPPASSTRRMRTCWSTSPARCCQPTASPTSTSGSTGASTS